MSSSLPPAVAALPPELDLAAFAPLLAPLTPSQLVWLSGYCFGRAGAGGWPEVAALPGAAADAAAAAPAAPPLTILYGSQTGNSRTVARQAADAARARGWAAKAIDLSEYAPRQLAREERLLLIVSTHGEGEPPPAAEALHTFVGGPRAARLPALRYAVLALGDRSYLHFCQTGRDFDDRLAALGATRLLERHDLDTDYAAPAAAWIAAVLDRFDATRPAAAPAARVVGEAAPAFTSSVAPSAAPTYSRQTPWGARVLVRQQLNGRGSTKETWHLELDVTASGLTYAPGDALAVVPRNAESLVETVLATAGLSDTALVTLAPGTTAEPLAAARDVVERYAALAPQPTLRELLTDTTRLQPFLYGRDVADLLHEFPTDQLTPQALADVLRPLPARAYSLASSLHTTPDEAHLTVGAVRYAARGRQRAGVCSGNLADRLAEGDVVQVYVQPNEFFRLPSDPATDVLMIGAGTGVAPFRGFVQERATLGAAGRNWLLFGNPHFATDFLYQTEWQQHLKQGTLTRLDVAFSREDPITKRYVQHTLAEQGRRVYEWLEGGATLYVCGDKARLAGAIRQTLTEVVARHGGLSAETAAEYVSTLRRQRRYQEDVY